MQNNVSQYKSVLYLQVIRVIWQSPLRTDDKQRRLRYTTSAILDFVASSLRNRVNTTPKWLALG